MFRTLLTLFCFNLCLTGLRADTVDVLHYTLRISSIDFNQKTLVAGCQLDFRSLSSTDTVDLSLLSLDVDSILFAGSLVSYTHNDTSLRIILGSVLNTGDTGSLNIYYHGTPGNDPSGWGGFYFSGSIAFNMGVGFANQPHTFGRAWFPCHDSFTDRATYTFIINTPAGQKAFCNGVLTGQAVQANGTINWTWEMNDRIPTYLAGIAVGPYYTLQRTSNGIPVEWACLPADSNKVLSTFIHLDTVLNDYILKWGNYPFDKVGYSLVPFTSGAMEHATCIHIGSGYVNGSLTYESLWAHELSHMWWGNKVTCEKQGDMWLNEGFASFNESLMTERLYGNTAYRNQIRSNHRYVLQSAHINDGSYLALENVPGDYTYGTTVYNKGSDVARTLRHTLGDSLFFGGCRYYLNQRSDSSANSFDLRDELSTFSGNNLSSFFEDWVFTPGFPHFSSDSLIVSQLPPYTHELYLRQRSRGNAHTYRHPVPVLLTNGISDTLLYFYCDSTLKSFSFVLPFAATQAWVDPYDFMADASVDNEKTVSATGGLVFEECALSLNVQQTGGSNARLRASHHWIQPDGYKSVNPGIKLSDYHYWKIEGMYAPGFWSKATFSYNGSTGPNGNMDNQLITGSEDSLIMLYRASPAFEWSPVLPYTLNKGGNSYDKVGSITIDTIKLGEYVFGYRDYLLSQPESSLPGKTYFSLRPNPSSGKVEILIENLKDYKNLRIEISDSSGRKVDTIRVPAEGKILWTAHENLNGMVFIELRNHMRTLETQRLILK